MKITGHSAESIFDSIREGIGEGRLPAGSVLPPVRELAEQLGVNRNTVAAAYKRLDAAGLASTAGRRGTVVRGLPPPLAREGSTPGLALQDLAGGNPDPRLLPNLRLAPAAPRLYGVGTVDPRLQALARASLDADCPAGYALELTHGAVDGIERLLAAWLLPGIASRWRIRASSAASMCSMPWATRRCRWRWTRMACRSNHFGRRWRPVHARCC